MSSSIGKVSSGSGGQSGVGGFMNSFLSAMSDGKIDGAEGKSLMDMAKGAIDQNGGKEAGGKDAAGQSGGCQGGSAGADKGLEQDIMKEFLKAMEDGEIDDKEMEKLKGLVAKGAEQADSSSAASA